jgi:hypothetical protein
MQLREKKRAHSPDPNYHLVSLKDAEQRDEDEKRQLEIEQNTKPLVSLE